MYSGKRFLLKIKNNKSLFIDKRFKNTVFSDSVIIRWSYKQYYIYVDLTKYCTVESHLSELISLMMKFYFVSIDSMHCCQSNSLIRRYAPIIWTKNHRLLSGTSINFYLYFQLCELYACWWNQINGLLPYRDYTFETTLSMLEIKLWMFMHLRAIYRCKNA